MTPTPLTTSRLRRALLGLAFALALAAPTTLVLAAQTCTSDADCSAGKTCQAGVCADPPQQQTPPANEGGGGIRPPVRVSSVPEFSTFGELFDTLKSVASSASLFVAIIFVILAGYMYITARGDEAEYTKAKSAMLSIAIGLGFIGLATSAIDAISGSVSSNPDDFKQVALSFWKEVLEPIVGFLTTIALIWSVLMFVIAGYGLISSGGDDAEWKKSRARLTNGAIGLVVIGLAKSATLIFSKSTGTIDEILDITKEGGTLAGGLKTGLISPILSFIVSLVGAVAIAMFVKAGYDFVTAQGDSKKVENAKNELQYGVVGLLVIGLAETAVSTIFKLDKGRLTISSSEGVKFIFQLINFALSFLGAISILMIVYAGFLYITDRGEGSGKKKAQDIIQYTTIGILAIIFSYAIVNIFITGGKAG